MFSLVGQHKHVRIKRGKCMLVNFHAGQYGAMFGFVLETSQTHRYFSCHLHTAFSASHTTPPASRLGGDTGRTAEQKDVPDHAPLCSAHEAGGRNGDEGVIQSDAFICPSNHQAQQSITFLGMTEYLPAQDGVNQLILICLYEQLLLY